MLDILEISDILSTVIYSLVLIIAMLLEQLAIFAQR